MRWLLFFLLTLSTQAQNLADTAVCSVTGGLQKGSLQARVDWFRARHPKGEISAWLYARKSAYSEDFRGGMVWKAGVLQTEPADQRHLGRLPAVDGECWLYLTASDPSRTGEDNPRIGTNIEEYYTFRDGGDDTDRLEILETRSPSGVLNFRCWIPEPSRFSLSPRPGSLKHWPEEKWQLLEVSPEFQELSQHPARIWKEAEDKLKQYTAYHYAAQEARGLSKPTILELGSNHWPTLPIGVFDANPAATFVTMDCHYSGLWLMEQVIERIRPAWQSRIHRYLADFSEPLPLPDQSTDLAVSVAAFGMMNFQAEEAWAVFVELERVLRPHGHFYCDCQDLEARPAWLTWSILQHYRLLRQWNGGRWRDACWEKRL